MQCHWATCTVYIFFFPSACLYCSQNFKLLLNMIFCRVCSVIFCFVTWIRRSQWPRGLRRRSAAARLLRSWVRIPPGAWMFVCCKCCVLSGRGLCDELITRPEESYQLWCVVVCDLETSRRRRLWPASGRSATEKKIVFFGAGVT